MKLNIRKLQQALNPAYRKPTVKREDMDAFKLHLSHLMPHINPAESEENAKSRLSTLLKSTFYGADYVLVTKER